VKDYKELDFENHSKRDLKRRFPTREIVLAEELLVEYGFDVEEENY
jgi:hypothetical protein